jgi:hypothetical protein
VSYAQRGEDVRDHLFLPDRQVKPGCSNAVDRAIGNYIVKHKPAVIVNIGDHADMESLSSYDVGKASAEGKRYAADIEASINAHEIMFQPLRELQKTQVLARADRWSHLVGGSLAVPEDFYDPETHICYGNHENRIIRAINDDPKLGGWMQLEDLEYNRFYKHVHPFLEPFIVDGVTYKHYAFKKIPSKAIGGDMIARTILNHEMTSISVGHCPEFHYYEKFRGDGKKIQCLVSGAAFDHNEPYAGERNKTYFRGIIHKYDVSDGVYDFEKISIERLFKNYL